MVAEIERAYYHPAPYLVFQAGEMRDSYPALAPGEKNNAPLTRHFLRAALGYPSPICLP